jgi:hypothetical protein
MSRDPSRRGSAVLLTLVLGACSAGPTRTGEPPSPSPEPGLPGPNVPAPTGTIYRSVREAAYTLHRHDSLDLQLPGGANQIQSIDRTAFIRVAIAPDSAGYQVTIVLDSLLASAGGVPAVLDSLTPARGTRWTARMTPEGRLTALVADRSSTLGDQVGTHLRSLFPGLPLGGVQAGMEWTDTTDVPLRADAFDASERALTHYRSSESDDSRAKKAIKLESSGTYQRAGKRTQFDQQLEMTATGSRSAVHYLSQDGYLLSAEGSDSGDMTITVPAVGQTVPVKQTGTYTITPLRPPKR